MAELEKQIADIKRDITDILCDGRLSPYKKRDALLTLIATREQPLIEANNRLRYLLWQHHGCASPCLYGDDGEMQCSNREHLSFGVDFKRHSVALLEWELASPEYRKIIERPKE